MSEYVDIKNPATNEVLAESHPIGTGSRIKEMRDAMQEFVDRCEDGEVLSKYTYAKFKEILDRVG